MVKVIVVLQSVQVYIVGALIRLVEFALSQTGSISGLSEKLNCFLADILQGYTALLKLIIAVFLNLQFFGYDAEVATLVNYLLRRR